MLGVTDTGELQVACNAAFKTIFEIMLANDVTTPTQINHCLSHQRDVLQSLGLENGAEFLESLRQFATDPERNAEREQLKRLAGEPPAGPAGAQ